MWVMLQNKQKPDTAQNTSRKYRGHIHRKRIVLPWEICLYLSKVCANTREETVVRIMMTNWYKQKSAEVVVLFFLQEGLNVRMAKESKRLWRNVNNGNT